MKKHHLYFLVSITLIVVWQYFGSSNNTARLYISSPLLIVAYIAEHYSELVRATITTFTEAVFGLLVAVGLSFVVMVSCFVRPKFLNFILPVMVVSQVIPVIVLAPFFIIVLGIGISSKIAMAVVISFFPTFISLVQGYKAIPKSIHELMQIYKAPLGFRIFRVYIPLAMPSLMAGLKVSATLAVIGAIVAEFTGAKYGIGKNLFLSAIRLDPDLMMSSLFLASMLGLCLYGLVVSIERKYGKWYLN